MPAAYPLSIRTILSAGKSRSQPAAFTMTEPRRGFAYVQAVGSEAPVLWDVSFRFQRPEAVQFQLWFTQIIRRGLDEFTMAIRTEFGMVDHVCRFTPDGLLPATQEGDTWGYRAQIMARAQVIPAGYAEAAELIVGLTGWEQWPGLLDQTVTAAMPAA